MSRKIIGVTVGSTLPKPNFKQTDPTKGDYIKNKPDFEGLKDKVDTIGNLVGDTSVSEQIAAAIGTGVEQVQADWDQTDETQPDFIKNKPDEMDALLLLSELDLTQPAFVDADNSVYLDESNNILIL